MDNIYCVYEHINKINGKKYFGISHDYKKRWKNGKGYIRNKDFYNDILTYGWENSFEHIVLEENLTLEEAGNKEKYYINLYETQNPEKGYNIRSGGSNGGTWSEEKKWEMSELKAELGLWKGNKNPRHIHPLCDKENGMYGKHHTEETKQKISKANSGRRKTEEQKQAISDFMNTKHPKAKKVRCIETGEIFLSSRKAAEAYGLGNSTISRICNGQRKPGKNALHWEWYTENDFNQ